MIVEIEMVWKFFGSIMILSTVFILFIVWLINKDDKDSY